MNSRLTLHVLLFAFLVLCSAQARLSAAGPRIGVLNPGIPERAAPLLAGLREGLREHGYIEGTNIAIETRFARGQFDRLPDLARELIGLPVDVLVTFYTQASIAAKDNTKTIPIVIVAVSDPTAAGLISGLSRPGGNITGTSAIASETAGKWLELLKEAVPGVRRVAVLWNPSNRVYQTQLIRETEAAARLLGIQVQLFEARDPQSIEKAFAAMDKARVSGLDVLPDAMFVAHGPRIAALAEAARLPSVSGGVSYADAGGLMDYGPSYPEMARTAGGYVAKILKGAKPADLPVAQPTKLELVINMKTAKRLGISIPMALQLRANRVIE